MIIDDYSEQCLTINKKKRTNKLTEKKWNDDE